MPPTGGPAIIPSLKMIPLQANIVPKQLGKAWAMMEKEATRKHEVPMVSMNWKYKEINQIICYTLKYNLNNNFSRELCALTFYINAK